MQFSMEQPLQNYTDVGNNSLNASSFIHKETTSSSCTSDPLVRQARVLIGMCLLQIAALVCASVVGSNLQSCSWLADASQPTIDCLSCQSQGVGLPEVIILTLGLLLSCLGIWAGYFRHAQSCRFFGWFMLMYCVGVTTYFFSVAINIPKYRTAVNQAADDACASLVQGLLVDAIVLCSLYGAVIVVGLLGAALALHVRRCYLEIQEEQKPFLHPPHSTTTLSLV